MLGIVAGSLSGLVGLALTVAVLGGADDAVGLVPALGLPCAVALVTVVLHPPVREWLATR